VPKNGNKSLLDRVLVLTFKHLFTSSSLSSIVSESVVQVSEKSLESVKMYIYVCFLHTWRLLLFETHDIKLYVLKVGIVATGVTFQI